MKEAEGFSGVYGPEKPVPISTHKKPEAASFSHGALGSLRNLQLQRGTALFCFLQLLVLKGGA